MKLEIDSSSVEEAVIVMRRTFDAPRELVWRAMTDPDLVARWLGPRDVRVEVTR